MHRDFRWSNRKGVSPLIGVTLLLTIAIALSAVLFFWQSGLLTHIGTNLEDQTALALKCQRAGLAIEYASYNCSNMCYPGTSGVDHNITLRLRNYGSIDLRLSSNVTIITRIGGIFEFYFSSLPSMLLAGESVTFSNILKMDCSLVNHTIDSIRVMTNCPDVQGFIAGNDVTWLSC